MESEHREGLVSRAPKLVRYSGVSVVTTAVTLILLAILLTSMTAGWANLAAVGVGSIVSFELNRRLVWRVADDRVRWAQLLCFVAVSLVFLAGSTLAVGMVAHAVGHALGSAARIAAIESTTVAVFAVRWLAQYALLDRVIFRATSPELVRS